jgi:hypothetical protein
MDPPMITARRLRIFVGNTLGMIHAHPVGCQGSLALVFVADFQFRYNNRMNADIFGTAISGC